VDSTKLNEFCSCPRQYFYKYVLHWVNETPNINLEFGTAWHIAKEHILLHGYSKESQEAAMVLFESSFRQSFSPQTDLSTAPKNPGNARVALEQYCKQFAGLNSEFKVLYTEVAGSVLLRDDQMLSYKIDAILEKEGKFYVLDHKTAKQLSDAWMRQFQLSFQLWIYIHVLCSIYGSEYVAGAIVDGTILRKGENAHVRIPVKHSSKSMNHVYWSIMHYMDMIKWNNRELEECSESDEVMTAFPMNTTSCTKWGQCPYLDLCTAWPNPLQHCNEPPLGMIKREWNPLVEHEDAKFKVNEGKVESK
jgi:hypothetical protein